MYPELQSAFLAEASAPLILLGGAVLLYRSFREKYLQPWIAGWSIYTLAKVFLAIHQPHGSYIWLALANVAFVSAVTLFSAAIFCYVYRPRLLLQISLIIFLALFMGLFEVILTAHANVLILFFAFFWRLIVWIAAWQLFLFARGRDNMGAWIVCAALLLLSQYHRAPAYGILADVLLGIGMMMIVLDDSRVQNERLDILNRLSQVVSSPDDFFTIVDTTLLELMQVTHAPAAWFRALEEDKLRVAVQHGLSDAVVDAIFEIDVFESTSGRLLVDGEIGVVSTANMMPEMQPIMSGQGIDHILVVPVLGKSSRIGLLVLAVLRPRSYTDNDRKFLKAAANQLGLAAENRRLVYQLVRSVHDLSETKAAEERYKTLFDHMQEGVFVSSPEGRVLDCNEAFVQMLGYSSKQDLFRVDLTQSLFVNAEERRRFLAEMQQKGFVRNFEFTLQRKDGRQINVIESSFATRNPDGKEQYQGVVLDITEKKKTENEMRRRNRELSALNTIAVSFNESFDLDESLQAVLMKIVELFGTDTAALYLFEREMNSVRRKASYGYRTVPPNDTHPLSIPTAMLNKIRAGHVEIIKNRDIMDVPVFRQIVATEDLQSSLWIILWRKDEILGALGTSSRSVHRFGPEDENIMVAMGRQLATTIDRIKLYDETRKAYDDLRRTQEQLLQSEKMSAVGRMISGVAHELNNPLTAISGYTQLLEGESTEPRIQGFIQKLYKQTERAQRIVQNLLSFSRQHKPQRIYADLRKVMEDTIALRDYELTSHNIVLQKEFEAALPPVVADPHQLEQVFLNIINNAVDAILETGHGGMLRIRIFSEDPDVVCEFHDSGPGMVDPKHVFDPFYTTKGVGKGTGLGLSICYGLVKEHGGEITAYNHAQGGAVVRVRLPEAVGEKPMSESERILARRESAMQGHALLVDAGEVIHFEREVLSAAGLDVVALSSGDEALQCLKQAILDVVLLDRQVPGWEKVLRWMQESRPEIISRVVLMLPAANSGPRSFTNGEGVLCFVKPFEATALLAVLRRILRASKTLAANPRE